MREWSRERELVKEAYNTPNWHEKVDRMSPNQVMAVYERLKAYGAFKKKKK